MRLLAVVTALVAAAGLVIQYVIFAGKVGPGLAAWRFIGFFTVLSNIAVAVVAAAVAVGHEGKLSGARARLMVLTAIVTVGFVYSLLLRSTWSPQGAQKIVDHALHDVTPILFAALWALMPHGSLQWRDMKWAMIPPAAYLAYAMGRGAIDGRYPYFFLNPETQSASELILSIFGVLVVFAVISGCAIAVDLRMGRRAASA